MAIKENGDVKIYLRIERSTRLFSVLLYFVFNTYVLCLIRWHNKQ